MMAKPVHEQYKLTRTARKLLYWDAGICILSCFVRRPCILRPRVEYPLYCSAPCTQISCCPPSPQLPCSGARVPTDAACDDPFFSCAWTKLQLPGLFSTPLRHKCCGFCRCFVGLTPGRERHSPQETRLFGHTLSPRICLWHEWCFIDARAFLVLVSNDTADCSTRTYLCCWLF